MERDESMLLNLSRHSESLDHKKLTSLKRIGIFAAVGLLLILLTGNTLVLRHHLNVQIENQAWVSHTRQVLLELERTESLLKDTESGQRGFLLTGNPEYLESYNVAVSQVMPHIDGLAKLTADNPLQLARIPELRSLAQAKLDELANTISLYKAGQFAGAQSLVQSDAGLAEMNRIRMYFEQMQLEETALIDSERAKVERSIRVTVFSIYLASFLTGAILIGLAYLILLEIKHRETYLDEIWKREEWYRVTLNSIGDAVICTDAEGKITLLNLVAERLTGWSLQDAIGKSMAEVFRIVDSVTRATLPDPMDDAIELNRTGHLPANCILIRRDGCEIFIEDSAAPIHNREKKITGSVIVFRDVSKARSLAELVVHASQHDPLTGLPNRLLLNDRLGMAIALAKRHRGQAAVIFLDLDGFKHINDSLGHLTGDKLLLSVAGRLKEHIRTPDTVSRQGGDEFVLLLQDVRKPEDAAITARRVLEAVSKVHIVDGHELFVTASLGVSMYPDDGPDAETLMMNADTAMYSAKENGRQCCRFFTPAMNVRAVERQSVEEDLRQALERNELSLHYQPKIDLQTGAIIGAEALLRWAHPTRGSVPPLQFIRIAEDSGLILPIGAWVLREAFKQACAWVGQGLPAITMAVNVSAVQFRDEDFLEDMFAVLAETGMDPGSVELELTESVLMHEPEQAASILQKLRDKGIVVSVDDFGTGYSSLSRLKRFPIDTLKIDQSFVHQLRDNPDDAAIVTAIISMGRSLNLRVIAEGVETGEDLSFLKEHECDEAQGFFFSKPVPAVEFATLLRKWPMKRGGKVGLDVELV